MSMQCAQSWWPFVSQKSCKYDGSWCCTDVSRSWLSSSTAGEEFSISSSLSPISLVWVENVSFHVAEVLCIIRGLPLQSKIRLFPLGLTTVYGLGLKGLVTLLCYLRCKRLDLRVWCWTVLHDYVCLHKLFSWASGGTVLSHCSSCILILWPNIGSAGGTPSPRISISMENNFSVPCPEIMGTHL